MSSDDQSIVEYREIKEFPGYRAGSDGSVWSCRPVNGRGPLKESWRKLNPSTDSKGRCVVSICSGACRRQFQVHTLVLLAFVGPKPPGMQCRHYPDPDPTNCRLGNLRWGTQKENAEDSVAKGVQVNGERCHRSKLTAEQVIEIRQQHTGKRGENVRLANIYGIAPTNISRIVSGKTWKHLLASPSNLPLRID